MVIGAMEAGQRIFEYLRKRSLYGFTSLVAFSVRAKGHRNFTNLSWHEHVQSARCGCVFDMVGRDLIGLIITF